MTEYLEPKVSFFKAEEFDMEHSGGLQAQKGRKDDEGIRSHWHPKHLIPIKECLKSTNSRSLGLSQQQERQLQGDLVKDLQS